MIKILQKTIIAGKDEPKAPVNIVPMIKKYEYSQGLPLTILRLISHVAITSVIRFCSKIATKTKNKIISQMLSLPTPVAMMVPAGATPVIAIAAMPKRHGQAGEQKLQP